MKLLSILLVCIGALATAQAAKPLSLEICFGENPSKENAPPQLTPEFLAAAKTLRIAVSPDDQGRVETPDGVIATYRLKQAHSLDLNVSLAGQNRREITTTLGLSLDKWVVLGALTRTEVATVKGKTHETRQNLVIAVRLVAAESP